MELTREDLKIIREEIHTTIRERNPENMKELKEVRAKLDTIIWDMSFEKGGKQ